MYDGILKINGFIKFNKLQKNHSFDFPYAPHTQGHHNFSF